MRRQHNTFGGGSPLPAGYIPLEYIESTGTQYINTNYFPTYNSCFYVEFMSTDNLNTADCVTATDSGYLISARDGGVNDRYYLTWSKSFLISRALNTLISVIYNDADHKLFINGVEKGTFNITSSQAGMSMYIFADHTSSGAQWFAKCRIYSYKITNNQTQEILMNFVPAYNTNTNKPGLYDLVGGQFYTNQGTGDFLYA